MKTITGGGSERATNRQPAENDGWSVGRDGYFKWWPEKKKTYARTTSYSYYYGHVAHDFSVGNTIYYYYRIRTTKALADPLQISDLLDFRSRRFRDDKIILRIDWSVTCLILPADTYIYDIMVIVGTRI